MTNQQQQRNLIVGGHNIQPGRYPYFVSIDKNNGVIVQGVLIAPDIVLSAGHIALNHMDNLTIKVGPYAVHEQEDFTEEIKMKEWIVPTSWRQIDPAYFVNDYMIVVLEEKSTHPLVKINRDPAIPYAGDLVVMAGLGWLNESILSPANIVQEVELETVDNQECEATKDPSRGLSYEGIIDESMLCTKSPPNTTRDGCAWDSGAPVIIAGKSFETDLLVGLGSAGIGCADKVFPAIQARIGCDFGLSWIRQQVCVHSVDPPEDFHCSTFNTTVTAKTTAALTASLAGPASFGGIISKSGSESSPAMFVVGCLVAVVALMVGRRLRSKKNGQIQHMPLSSSRTQSPAAYGSIVV